MKPRTVQVCEKDSVTGEVRCYDKIVDDDAPIVVEDDMSDGEPSYDN